MHAQGVPSFPYFVGIDSLADVATRGDRVCVLNILGGESRQVTPTSHVFSGGNVAFGTSPGRGGQVLRTALGDIPVFNNVREGLNAGHAFNTGVVYLPPSGVRDGVAELIRVNSGLKKIVIVTEKIAVAGGGASPVSTPITRGSSGCSITAAPAKTGASASAFPCRTSPATSDSQWMRRFWSSGLSAERTNSANKSKQRTS